MTQRTVLFLDVDGVLSPFDHALPDWYSDWQEPEDFGFHAPLSREMGDRIASWGVEIVWLTTWMHEANQRIVPMFGWDEKETLIRSGRRFDDDDSRTGWWKMDCALDWLAQNSIDRLVWLDDDLNEPLDHGYEDARELLMTKVGITPDRFYLLAPNRRTGLTPDQLSDIESWLRNERED